MTSARTWHTSAIMMLKRLYPICANAELAKYFKRSEYAVLSKASEMGLKKSPTYLAGCRVRKPRDRSAPKPSGYFTSLAPEKPTERPQDRLRGICYGVPVAKPGVALNGERLKRHMAWVA